MSANAVLRNRRLSGIREDLTTEPAWRYDELLPFLLSQLTERNLFEASDSELARTVWFWSRRPKLMVHDGAAAIVVALCICISLFIAFFTWPRTPINRTSAQRRISISVLNTNQFQGAIFDWLIG